MVDQKVSNSVMLDIGDSFTDQSFVDDGFLVARASHQGGGADLVDAAREALGVLDAGDSICFCQAKTGIVGEKGSGGKASDLDVVFDDIADGLLEVKRRERV